MKLLLDLEQMPQDRCFSEFAAKEKRMGIFPLVVTGYFTK